MQRLANRIAELRDRVSRGAFKQLVLDGGWAERSGGRCCYVMVFKQAAGMNMTQQIEAALV